MSLSSLPTGKRSFSLFLRDQIYHCFVPLSSVADTTPAVYSAYNTPVWHRKPAVPSQTPDLFRCRSYTRDFSRSYRLPEQTLFLSLSLLRFWVPRLISARNLSSLIIPITSASSPDNIYFSGSLRLICPILRQNRPHIPAASLSSGQQEDQRYQ